jgi:hypothetical protein
VVADLGCRQQVLLQPLGIEIDVRDGGEEEFQDGHVDFPISRPQLCGPRGVHRDALGRLDQQVLQGRGGGVFAAYAHGRATGAIGGLLALITVHGHDFSLSTFD